MSGIEMFLFVLVQILLQLFIDILIILFLKRLKSGSKVPPTMASAALKNNKRVAGTRV
ncbi:hypothetical protein BCR39DRAFT_542247 [Naematelia encephala]|uniref:Uncharacterized protein n=1 Tax=Naematelia encephala TaxID=71784 RepID=A0A1Y2AU91_9TREE|nr:hypothetical protein BCR39DRAFT_542247 [Naematelia encephala]